MSTHEEAPPVKILLVEDNPGDYRLTQEALREGKVYNNLHWAQDGVEAIEFLNRRGKYAGFRPDWKKAYVRLKAGEKMPEYVSNL